MNTENSTSGLDSATASAAHSADMPMPGTSATRTGPTRSDSRPAYADSDQPTAEPSRIGTAIACSDQPSSPSRSGPSRFTTAAQKASIDATARPAITSGCRIERPRSRRMPERRRLLAPGRRHDRDDGRDAADQRDQAEREGRRRPAAERAEHRPGDRPGGDQAHDAADHLAAALRRRVRRQPRHRRAPAGRVRQTLRGARRHQHADRRRERERHGRDREAARCRRSRRAAAPTCPASQPVGTAAIRIATGSAASTSPASAFDRSNFSA